MIKATFTADDDTMADLKALAASKNSTVSEYVRALVSCHVAAERKRPRPQFVERKPVVRETFKGRIMKCN